MSDVNRRHTHRSVLRQREALVLDNAQGTAIAVDRGCLWVTLEHDLRDIVLGQGMRFEIDRPGRTIVAAEAESALRLSAPANVRERIAAALARVRAGLLDGWAGRLSHRIAPRA